MNNGRLWTLMDLGRYDLAFRMGMMQMARREGWFFVVAGGSIRYRRRLPPDGDREDAWGNRSGPSASSESSVGRADASTPTEAAIEDVISRTATEQDLKDAFAAFGEVSSAAIIKDKFSGESRNETRPRTDRPRTGGGGGRGGFGGGRY